MEGANDAAAGGEKPSTAPLQQMIARHLLDPGTTIPTDNAKLRVAVSSGSTSPSCGMRASSVSALLVHVYPGGQMQKMQSLIGLDSSIT